MNIYIIRARFAHSRESFGERLRVPNLGVYLCPDDAYEAARLGPDDTVVETWQVAPMKCIQETTGRAFMELLDMG